jgi:hypothetical protein
MEHDLVDDHVRTRRDGQKRDQDKQGSSQERTHPDGIKKRVVSQDAALGSLTHVQLRLQAGRNDEIVIRVAQRRDCVSRLRPEVDVTCQ